MSSSTMCSQPTPSEVRAVNHRGSLRPILRRTNTPSSGAVAQPVEQLGSGDTITRSSFFIGRTISSLHLGNLNHFASTQTMVSDKMTEQTTSGRVVRYQDPRGVFRLLPPELMLMICSGVSPVDRIALALTCKPLYNMLFYSNPKAAIGTYFQDDLKELLEMQYSDCFFCRTCGLLHGLDRDPSVAYKAVCKRECSRLWQFPDVPTAEYTLKYHAAHLVMLRHRLGSSFGFPLTVLEEDIRMPGTSDGIVFHRKASARIDNNELLVSVAYAFSHNSDDFQELRRFLTEDLHLRPCEHVEMGSELCFTTTYHATEFCASFLKEPMDSYAGTIKSCANCHTDYVVHVKWQGMSQGWSIEVATYHNFGKCQSPFDDDWYYMTACPGNSLQRVLMLDKSGSVIRRWYRSSGGAVNVDHMRGRWVAVSPQQDVRQPENGFDPDNNGGWPSYDESDRRTIWVGLNSRILGVWTYLRNCLERLGSRIR
ncbi:hypothetical protein S40288_11156 [Stachybotrys chartarum IBT 40288]|nr:hypothetical protein S40288_11156 [Stachybotrys chartarum IBT 40288]